MVLSIFSRLLTSNQNGRSVWSRRLASRSSPTNLAASRPPVGWRHFDVILLKSTATILAAATFVGDRTTASTSLSGAATVVSAVLDMGRFSATRPNPTRYRTDRIRPDPKISFKKPDPTHLTHDRHDPNWAYYITQNYWYTSALVISMQFNTRHSFQLSRLKVKKVKG